MGICASNDWHAQEVDRLRVSLRRSENREATYNSRIVDLQKAQSATREIRQREGGGGPPELEELLRAVKERVTELLQEVKAEVEKLEQSLVKLSPQINKKDIPSVDDLKEDRKLRASESSAVSKLDDALKPLERSAQLLENSNGDKIKVVRANVLVLRARLGELLE